MDIKQLKIDFNNNILEINGKTVKDRPVLVSLPGPDGWKYKKIFNPSSASGNQKECEKLDVIYRKATSSKL